MKSIDRLAMELTGKMKDSALDHLNRFGFSLAEASEIVQQFATGDTDTIAAPWTNVAAAIRSTMLCSVRIGDRLDMNIDGYTNYSHHNDQAISGDDLNRRHREKDLGFCKASVDWANCKNIIRCAWTGQVPRGPVDINNTYFHCTPEAG